VAGGREGSAEADEERGEWIRSRWEKGEKKKRGK
jgi:hypothetical protein